jgi:hypothetical protein
VFSGASEKLVLYDSCSLGFLCYNYINLYLYRLILRGISFSLHIQIKQAWRGQIVVRCKAVRAMEVIPGRTAVIYFRKRQDRQGQDTSNCNQLLTGAPVTTHTVQVTGECNIVVVRCNGSQSRL